MIRIAIHLSDGITFITPMDTRVIGIPLEIKIDNERIAKLCGKSKKGYFYYKEFVK